MRKFRIEYLFVNSKFGFSNSVTVEAINEDQATEKAKGEVRDCYGSKMFPRFQFRQPIAL